MTARAPLWKKLAFPAFLVLLIVLGVAGMRLTMRDPQGHAHGPIEKMLFRPEEAFNFKLTDQNGKPLELKQFRGKTVFFAFGFTHCPSICPATLSYFSAIKDALPENIRDKVVFLFVSVDPQRDTPERLKEFVNFYDPEFIGVTGETMELKSAAYKYRANFTLGRPKDGDPKDYSVDHSADAYLIGPDGRWMMSYPFEELPKTSVIVRDIEKLASNTK